MLRDFLAMRISSRKAIGRKRRITRFLAPGCARDQPRHRLCVAVGLCHRAAGRTARFRLAGANIHRLQPCRRRGRRRDRPKELPAQMLDHATGYLMAFGAMMAGRANRAKAAAGMCGSRWRRPGAGFGISAASPTDLRPRILKAKRSAFLEESTLRVRPASCGPPFGRPAEDAGVLGPPGDAAWQLSGAMAGARLKVNHSAVREEPAGCRNFNVKRGAARVFRLFETSIGPY